MYVAEVHDGQINLHVVLWFSQASTVYTATATYTVVNQTVVCVVSFRRFTFVLGLHKLNTLMADLLTVYVQ